MKLFLLISILFAFMVPGAFADQYYVTQQQLAITATGTSTQVLVQDLRRKYLLIQNTGTDTVFIKAGSAHTGTEGIALLAGAVWEPGPIPIDAFWLKSNSGSQSIVVIEGN